MYLVQIAAPNVYVVSPAFDVGLLSGAAVDEFAASFNRQRLSTILVQFSQPRPFGEHMAPFAQSRGTVREQQVGAFLQINVYILDIQLEVSFLCGI